MASIAGAVLLVVHSTGSEGGSLLALAGGPFTKRKEHPDERIPQRTQILHRTVKFIVDAID
jgi:hypothetical protein